MGPRRAPLKSGAFTGGAAGGCWTEAARPDGQLERDGEMRIFLIAAIGAVMTLNATCGASRSTAREGVQKPHHTANGFQNNHPHEIHGFADLFQWRWDRLWGHVPEGPREEREYEFPLAENDPAYLRANRSETTVTWIGHAALLIQWHGINLLTDPMFSERAFPVQWTGPQRFAPLGLALQDLPPIDVVLLSHNHYDHLDVDTVGYLKDQRGAGQGPRFFVPLGLKAWFADQGIDDVVELDWWEHESYMGLEIHAVPAQHFSSRTPFDRNETLWAGWVVAAPGFRFYYSGDTGYSTDFQEIGRRLGPMDFSAIPIGAYAPRWFMKPVHVNPEEAVRIHREVGSRLSVGIHWGTFSLTDEALDEPPIRLAAAVKSSRLPGGSFFVMQHGETRLLDGLLVQRDAP